MMNNQFIQAILKYKMRLKKGWFRKWNFDENYTFSEFYKFDSVKKSDFIENIKLEIIDLMFLFTNYPNSQLFDEVLSDFENLEFIIFKQFRIDVQKRKMRSIVLSFKDSHENRIDLLFEYNSKNREQIDNIRLFVSDFEIYKQNNHFDMLYWNASDRRSFEQFNNSFLDIKAFISKNQKQKMNFFDLLKLIYK